MSAGPAAPPWTGEGREELRRRLQALGFDEVRFAAIEEVGGRELREWLAAGMHAEMAWMNAHEPVRESRSQKTSTEGHKENEGLPQG